jgi:hypothetical protein
LKDGRGQQNKDENRVGLGRGKEQCPGWRERERHGGGGEWHAFCVSGSRSAGREAKMRVIITGFVTIVSHCEQHL